MIPAAVPPDAPAVSAALTETEVEVSSDFRGARIVLYGAVFDPGEAPVDVVVVVRGPEQTVRLVRKMRVAGVWLNSRPVVFEGAPGFYQASSTRALSRVADFGTLRRLGVGVDHLKIDAPEESRTETRYGIKDVVVSRLGEDYLDWRRAVIRLKERERLYSVDPKGVRFVDRGLFRAEVDLPADAPTGTYRTEVWLFQDGEPVSVRRRNLTVEKVGIERAVYEFAHRRPWLYGVVSVLVAALSGWAASRLFRRS
ncbi:MAG TPA: TIGR02186 family protein [Caulobacteraceae bacterium]|nr:TIGR02186 family protein [Caulobacteraceae bacterium]